MPSFDITSEFDKQEVLNAVDQSKREIVNRYDFKNTSTSIKMKVTILKYYAKRSLFINRGVTKNTF